MGCTICRSEKISLANQFDDYAIMECGDCKYAMVDPMPDSETLDRLYNSKAYFDTHMRYNFETITDTEIDKLVQQQFIFHTAMLKGVEVNAGKKMLEVGPGGGFALKAFTLMGYEVMGLETSEVASSFIKKRLGLQVINSSIEDYDPTQYGKYDLILLNHVLEHFIEPEAAMQKLRLMLAPGGLLYIRVPDHDSYDRRAYGKAWPAYAQYHISNFSEKSLSILLKRNGLKILWFKKFTSEKMPAIFSIFLKLPLINSLLVNSFSGRTISVLSRL